MIRAGVRTLTRLCTSLTWQTKHSLPQSSRLYAATMDNRDEPGGAQDDAKASDAKRQPVDAAGKPQRKRRKMPKPNKERARSNQCEKLKGRSITEEFLTETTPYIDADTGFRRVPPYYFTFNSYAKGRWMGRTILDVFADEFRAETREYYEQAILDGRITVDEKRVGTDFVLDNNQVIINHVHRHEPPVTTDVINVIHENEDFFVIDKPASIPVHPCGRYRHNTIQGLLAHELKRFQAYPCHRLDRLTSGILIFAKSQAAAKKTELNIRSRQVQKHYVCRVVGVFPQKAECDKPLKIADQRLGLCCVHPEGKEAKTSFELISTDGKTSVVKCAPETGRMHQIRVHLQYLGHPITNDPIYNNPIWGEARGKGFEGDATELQRLSHAISERIRLSGAAQSQAELCSFEELAAEAAASKQPRGADANADVNVDAANPNAEPSKDDVEFKEDNADKAVVHSTEPVLHPRHSELPEPARHVYAPWCTECRVQRDDPQPEAMRIYLHAYRYQGPDWDFETEMPWWARDDFELALARRKEAY